MAKKNVLSRLKFGDDDHHRQHQNRGRWRPRSALLLMFIPPLVLFGLLTSFYIILSSSTTPLNDLPVEDNKFINGHYLWLASHRQRPTPGDVVAIYEMEYALLYKLNCHYSHGSLLARWEIVMESRFGHYSACHVALSHRERGRGRLPLSRGKSGHQFEFETKNLRFDSRRNLNTSTLVIDERVQLPDNVSDPIRCRDGIYNFDMNMRCVLGREEEGKRMDVTCPNIGIKFFHHRFMFMGGVFGEMVNAPMRCRKSYALVKV